MIDPVRFEKLVADSILTSALDMYPRETILLLAEKPRIDQRNPDFASCRAWARILWLPTRDAANGPQCDERFAFASLRYPPAVNPRPEPLLW